MELIAPVDERGCPDGYGVANPYTVAFGNRDFNSRYFATVIAAQSFLGNLDYNWIDMAGLYIKGRGETPELSEDLEGIFEAWEFTDRLGISNGQTYVAYCPVGYQPRLSEDPRHGCELIARMQEMHDSIQLQRVQDALDAGRITLEEVGDDMLNPTDPPAVEAAIAQFRPQNYSEYFELQSHQEMARFHLEILSRIW